MKHIYNMNVKKRNGSFQNVSFDKILWRLKSLALKEPKLENIDITPISQNVISQLYSGIETCKLDELAATVKSWDALHVIAYPNAQSEIIPLW